MSVGAITQKSLTEENNIWYVVDPITEEGVVTFSVKNRLNNPKTIVNENKFDGQKKTLVTNTGSTQKEEKILFCIVLKFS